MGSTWGPPGSCRPQMGPMLAPSTLLSAKLSMEMMGSPILVRQVLYIETTPCFFSLIITIWNLPLPVNLCWLNWGENQEKSYTVHFQMMILWNIFIGTKTVVYARLMQDNDVNKISDIEMLHCKVYTKDKKVWLQGHTHNEFKVM